MDHQSVVCDKCTGVLLATDSRTYTAQRGRLIVTNGYCTCPAAQAPAEQVTDQQQPQPAAEQSATQRQPAHPPQQNAQPTGQNSMVVA
ncbi:hypothetical protein OG884_13760 [Streptosporangium sp. NBC_01755]|uniref:hypothetical protein n=1 Tax=unclassified Streptosporangium TaxID=2632669 RepID=UPI002DDA6310|nr:MULTISPECIES: hypothetical protein [unclassified Streptosporangium]WSA25696.1 hypothetical protein OIE13_33105 [Streptosporangium sp. NBC_01810]WSD02914.1 hypothetical protein OG884_13760 [Streptosporangium sp. NBC_01755]